MPLGLWSGGRLSGAMSMSYLRRSYGVPVARGRHMHVVVSGVVRCGTIIRASHYAIYVRLEGEAHAKAYDPRDPRLTYVTDATQRCGGVSGGAATVDAMSDAPPTAETEGRIADAGPSEAFARSFAAEMVDADVCVLLNHGLYRHLQCQPQGVLGRPFDLMTWPGRLCISGDMGTYVFEGPLLDDLFAFFRTGRGTVNLDYWATKLISQDVPVGYQAYAPAKFRAAIHEYLADWLEAPSEEPLTDTEITELRDCVAADVLSWAGDGELDAYRAARDFVWRAESGIFAGFEETNLREYTTQFVWSCHAIAWAIAAWDRLTDGPAAAEHVRRSPCA